jgi:hypothetical protein
MRPKLYHVALVPEQREYLTRHSLSQRHSACERKRARILLLADEAQEKGATPDAAIAAQIKVCLLTVFRVRQRFAQDKEQSQKEQSQNEFQVALHKSLRHKPQERRKARVLDGAAEAHLVALTCSTPPEGRKEWSLHLLKDTLIEQRIVDSISHETVRQTLKKTNLSRG